MPKAECQLINEPLTDCKSISLKQTFEPGTAVSKAAFSMSCSVTES